MERFRAFLSYVLSYRRRKGSWRFADYPVCVTPQRSDDCLRATATRRDYPSYRIKWSTIAGLGDTPNAAIDDLRQNFVDYKRNNDTIPRPGCHVFVQFAESFFFERLDPEIYRTFAESDPEMLRKFMIDVLRLRPDEPLRISNESSLFDFAGEDGGICLFERIREVFGVDLSDVTDGNLASVLSRIQDATREPREGLIAPKSGG